MYITFYENKTRKAVFSTSLNFLEPIQGSACIFCEYLNFSISNIRTSVNDAVSEAKFWPHALQPHERQYLVTEGTICDFTKNKLSSPACSTSHTVKIIVTACDTFKRKKYSDISTFFL